MGIVRAFGKQDLAGAAAGVGAGGGDRAEQPRGAGGAEGPRGPAERPSAGGADRRQVAVLLRALLLFLFFMFLARAVWRLLDGVMRGAGRPGNRPTGGPPGCRPAVGGEDGPVSRSAAPTSCRARRSPASARGRPCTSAPTRAARSSRPERVRLARAHRGADQGGHRRVRAPAVAPRLRGVERRQHQRPPRRPRVITTPKSVSKGFMTPDMMVVTDLTGRSCPASANASSELKMHLEVYRTGPTCGPWCTRTRRPRPASRWPASRSTAPCWPRWSPRSAASRSPSTPRRPPRSCRRRAQVHQGARRVAAGQPRRAGGGPDLFTRLLPDGDHRALRAHQPGGAQLGANTCCRAGGGPAAGAARDVRHRLAGADLRRRDRHAGRNGRWTARWCRRPNRAGRAAGARHSTVPRARRGADGTDAEIRLTYRELTALIEDAKRSQLEG
jgi:hypothetical protein